MAVIYFSKIALYNHGIIKNQTFLKLLLLMQPSHNKNLTFLTLAQKISALIHEFISGEVNEFFIK